MFTAPGNDQAIGHGSFENDADYFHPHSVAGGRRPLPQIWWAPGAVRAVPSRPAIFLSGARPIKWVSRWFRVIR